MHECVHHTCTAVFSFQSHEVSQLNRVILLTESDHIGTTSELPLIGITNFWNYHSLMLVIAMLVTPRFLIGISIS